jgi:predicted ATPase
MSDSSAPGTHAAAERSRPRIFLSYASEERNRALHIADALEGAGLSVWIDRRGIAVGRRWSREIAAAIRSCTAFAVLCSAGSMRSRNVRQELQLAWDFDRPILPLLLEPIAFPEDRAYFLHGWQWVEILDRPAAEWLPEVFGALRGLHVGAAVADDTLSVRVAAALPPSNLPVPPTSMVGRGREAADVRAILLRHDVRLATLTGPGGIGKTRLAIHVATGMLGAFPDGVFFVDLAPLHEAALVESAIAIALGVREETGRPLATTLTAWLRDRRVLVVLDTFETVTAAATLIADLLRAAPLLKILATSRTPLRLLAEYEFPLAPLPACGPTEQPLEELIACDAVQLFFERASAFLPEFTANADNIATIAAICARLDGLPLAIELIAARVKIFPPAALLHRLERRLPLLTGGARDLPDRQRTLRDTIAWSYDLLPAPDRALFRRLAVFAGGFDLAAAEAVCGETVDGRPPGEPVASTVEGVAALIDHSLLQQRSLPDRREEPRFGFLDTIREFGLAMLEETGEIDAIGRRHADYFLARAEQAMGHLHVAERERWLDRLERDGDNFRATLRWLRQHDDQASGLRLAGALWQFWWWRTRLAEGRDWLESFLALPTTEPTTVVRARALTGAGTIAETQGDNDRAEAFFEEADQICRKLGDRRGLANSLLFRWLVAFDREDDARMTELAEASYRTFREIGDEWGIALALTESGIVAMLHQDWARGEPLLAESLARFRRIEDAWGIAIAVGTLGNVAVAKGEFAIGAARLEESLRLLLGMGDRWGLATILHSPARAAADQRQFARATRLMAAATSLCDAIGAPLRVPFRRRFERNLHDARSALGEQAFARAWEEGRRMSPEQAVDYACRPESEAEVGAPP